MTIRLLILCLILTLSLARTATVQASDLASSASSLQMTAEERQFFELGMTLSRGAFAYAELAKQATVVSRTRSKLSQVRQLGRLAPMAQRNRRQAGVEIADSLVLMRTMCAPDSAQKPVRQASDRLSGTLPLTSDARPVGLFNGQAAQTISALAEFETLSSLPEDAALRKWISAPGVSAAAQVWYGEGEMAALAQIASTHQMPELLPPAQQIATDLRGLRDWLSLRLPDNPTPDQTALRSALDAFLRESAESSSPGRKSRKQLTLAQLENLGAICQRLQVQVMGQESSQIKTAVR